jgi:signal transduction histidine kinase
MKLLSGLRSSNSTQTPSSSGWRFFKGARPRILVWYFLLTAFSSVTSILVTHQIFYDRIRMQAKVYVRQQVSEFRQLANDRSAAGKLSDQDVATLFDSFLSSYHPIGKDNHAIALIDGHVYKSSSEFTERLLTSETQLIRYWAMLKQPDQAKVSTQSMGNIYYLAQPVVQEGKIRGVLVVIHCINNGYKMVDGAVLLVIQANLAVLGIATLIAWVTTKRVLAPLSLLTKTAQSITESDMSQRIPVTGSDEIAELTATFNAMLDRLQLAFNSQQEFLKDVGHELRTPITVIQGNLEMLQYCPEKQPQMIALVMDELNRMGRLVNDLLLLAKAENPDFLNLKPEELDWLTEDFYLKARLLADREWKLESKGLSPIVVDRQRLTQAVMNLIQNAVRHTQVGDTITLGSSVQGDRAYIWVRDTGTGIAPEDQQRIFERFVRGSNHEEGHGLGLSIVQAIAQAHGGWVELVSQFGQGSTFTLVLPLNSPPNVASTHESDSHRRRQSPHYQFFGNRLTSPRFYNHSR